MGTGSQQEEAIMRTLVAMLIGVVLGAGITALTSRAELSMFDVPLNTQNEIEHAALIEQEYAETIPLPRWSPPSLPARPCDRCTINEPVKGRNRI
jgi:hypothetical protein